jgi:hypothetical protein
VWANPEKTNVFNVPFSKKKKSITLNNWKA